MWNENEKTIHVPPEINIFVFHMFIAKFSSQRKIHKFRNISFECDAWREKEEGAREILCCRNNDNIAQPKKKHIKTVCSNKNVAPSPISHLILLCSLPIYALLLSFFTSSSGRLTSYFRVLYWARNTMSKHITKWRHFHSKHEFSIIIKTGKKRIVFIQCLCNTQFDACVSHVNYTLVYCCYVPQMIISTRTYSHILTPH